MNDPEETPLQNPMLSLKINNIVEDFKFEIHKRAEELMKPPKF